MPKPLAEMESLFMALADATRLRILGLRRAGEACVCNTHESLKIRQSKASRHPAYLRRSGLVETRRDGLRVHYRLGTFADPVMAAIGDAVRHALTHVDTVHRDGEHLQKRTGCSVTGPRELGRVSCRAPAATTVDAGGEMSATVMRRTL